MPRKEIDYSKTVIYKIVCNDLNVKDVYVGHTTDFTKRKASHKYTTKYQSQKNHNLYLYKKIRENGNWQNWSMIEIEKFPCNDRNEACTRERHFYELLNANLNMVCPILTIEEIEEYKKDYIEQHKNEKKENDKKYAQKNEKK